MYKRQPENGIKEVTDGSISFENVSFKYNLGAKEYALSNVNFNIKAGETIGILGSTGSAKSTLVQLIPRLYDATKGIVKVGGRDVREYDLCIPVSYTHLWFIDLSQRKRL